MDMFDSSSNLKEILQKDRYVGLTRGRSMRPMIISGKDIVVIEAKEGRLNKYDVALYTKNGGYVLHRVIAVADKGYLIRGDNCYFDEKVPEEDVFGVLKGYFKGEKYIPVTDKKYLKYAVRRVKNYKIRKIWYSVYRKFRKTAKRIIKGKE